MEVLAPVVDGCPGPRAGLDSEVRDLGPDHEVLTESLEHESTDSLNTVAWIKGDENKLLPVRSQERHMSREQPPVYGSLRPAAHVFLPVRAPSPSAQSGGARFTILMHPYAGSMASV